MIVRTRILPWGFLPYPRYLARLPCVNEFEKEVCLLFPGNENVYLGWGAPTDEKEIRDSFLHLSYIYL